MRYLLLLVVILGGCSMAESVRKVADQANVILEDARGIYGDAKRTYEEARAAADTDQSGDVSMEEWIAYLAGIAGVGGGGLLARNAKSNARKDLMESEIATLKAKLPT